MQATPALNFDQRAMPKHKPKTTHDVRHRIDPKTGTAEVGVRLSNSKDRAWTSLDAYERILEKYGPRAWFLNSNSRGRAYVRLVPATTGQPVMVSRLVLGVPPRKVIKHFDGDRLNLRPSNLVIVSSYGLAKRAGARAKASPTKTSFEAQADALYRQTYGRETLTTADTDAFVERTGFLPTPDERHYIALGFAQAAVVKLLQGEAHGDMEQEVRLRQRADALTAWQAAWCGGTPDIPLSNPWAEIEEMSDVG